MSQIICFTLFVTILIGLDVFVNMKYPGSVIALYSDGTVKLTENRLVKRYNHSFEL